MRQMAREELETIRRALPDAERDLALRLLPRDAADERPAMLEIRAGTGGDEAALFAGDLFRMYQRYAEDRGWRIELISASASDVGGYRSEEHTSELQSLMRISYAVFCLKKKTKINLKLNTPTHKNTKQ